MNAQNVFLFLGGVAVGWIGYRYRADKKFQKRLDAKAEKVTAELEQTFNDLLSTAAKQGASAADVKRTLEAEKQI